MDFFVGSYATSPAWETWDPEAEQAYFAKLKTFTHLQGLEHPFTGTLHPHDDDWFMANVSAKWQFVFTCVPGTMGALGKNPHFGIASDDEAGRQEALVFMQKACDAIGKLNRGLGRKAVKAIEVQTAPDRSKASGSARSLKASLETMLSWDWHGADIVIEHCDALVPEHDHAKGFLSLDDEITVLKELNASKDANLGILINWGRSAIETLSTDGVLTHIEQVKQQGLFKGLMFSGVTDQSSPYGIWKDTHMPAAKSPNVAFGAEHSLLTEQEIHRSLAACGHALTQDSIVGIKLGIRPKDAPLEPRVGYNQSALAMIERFFN
ncbi:DUF4862 family protein [Paraglaciecola polaris]|uniref:DUF4862 domain-containing protein n=1 Tax=Paraglaciecola polaris LMG 21857 TaxID=1129793 RepID=K6YJ15_9ALTE|nr:DUF4862 family protein [Paraglaciecola polaris]GAC32729.1 hypothetical protein GPLA_1822 [Paraglaciecola polaris LMG 21857]|tara:strand:+ start:6411 stop:7376 length:966 start_codon:yes stop_codon:yes gene_type:complete